MFLSKFLPNYCKFEATELVHGGVLSDVCHLRRSHGGLFRNFLFSFFFFGRIGVSIALVGLSASFSFFFFFFFFFFTFLKFFQFSDFPSKGF